MTANKTPDGLVLGFRHILESLHQSLLQGQKLRQEAHQSQLCLLEKEDHPVSLGFPCKTFLRKTLGLAQDVYV